MSDKLNIQQKLVEVRKSIHGFNKDKKRLYFLSFFFYNYYVR